MTFNTKADIQGPLGSDLLDVRASRQAEPLLCWVENTGNEGHVH